MPELSEAEKIALRNKIADRLVDMEAMFDPRCKLTFVMRAPHLGDGDLVVTGDDIDAVIAALTRLKIKPCVPAAERIAREEGGLPH